MAGTSQQEPLSTVKWNKGIKIAQKLKRGRPACGVCGAAAANSFNYGVPKT